jgi:hypothetical protein
MSTQTDRLGGAKGSLAWKAPCRVATTANITLSGTQTIDGIAVVAEDRVLVKDQTAGADNGIYVVKSSAWVRAKDFNGNQEVVRGTRIYVTDGTAGQGEYTVLNTSSPVVIGTDTLTITKESPVDGPASSVDANLASFSGTSGTQIQDSGIASASILSTALIGSTGTNGIQAYTAASTDVVVAADIGSTSRTNNVQRYTGSTATVLTTADAGSTSGNRAFERSWGLDSYTGTAYNTTSGGTYTPNRDNGLIHTITNNANEGTVNIAAPSNYGLVIIEVSNSATPGPLATTAYNLVNGNSPSTEPNAVQIAKCWRTANTNLIEWFTT